MIYSPAHMRFIFYVIHFLPFHKKTFSFSFFRFASGFIHESIIVEWTEFKDLFLSRFFFLFLQNQTKDLFFMIYLN